MKTLSIKVRDFDLKKIFNSGLFYFFYTESPERTIYINNNPVKLSFSQNANRLRIRTEDKLNPEEVHKLKRRITHCFGTREDQSDFYRICNRDPVLKNFLKQIKETRIISAYKDFEALVGAIISQNNSYRNYRTQMRKIYESINFRKDKFTTANLEKLKLGYKIEYLLNLKEGFDSKEINEIRGIGNYSVNLYKIFQKRDYSAFYMDCLMERIMREKYGIKDNFIEYSHKLWGDYRGLAGAYLQRFFEKK